MTFPGVSARATIIPYNILPFDRDYEPSRFASWSV